MDNLLRFQHPTHLVEKLVLRTHPVNLGNSRGDWSYTTSPIFITKVTENHIYYKTALGGGILNNRYLDNKWVEYEGQDIDEIMAKIHNKDEK